MSRTYHHKKRKWRNLENAMYKKLLRTYYEDIHSKNKISRRITKQILRARIKEQSRREIDDVL